MYWIKYILQDRRFLLLMLVINILGTIYGYIWYGSQLAETPPVFLAFVPDSPTASLFFVVVLIGFLFKKSFPMFEALAVVTLFKYGIWAVIMNMLVYVVTGSLGIVGLMLIFSHLGMAIQGLLYTPFYRIRLVHLVLVGIWTLHNDVIDYVFFMMPRYHMLDKYNSEIGYFTFWLSIVSLSMVYFLTIYKNGRTSAK